MADWLVDQRADGAVDERNGDDDDDNRQQRESCTTMTMATTGNNASALELVPRRFNLAGICFARSLLLFQYSCQRNKH